MSDAWRVTLFGGLRAQRGEQVITRFKTQKVASLFAYLAHYLRRAHSREILIELLWPESDAPTLRNSLSVALSTLRNQFEPPGVPHGTVFRADRFKVGFNPAAVTTDVAEFEQALKAAAKAGSATERSQHLASAIELYQGSLLPGFYEEWIPAEQERLSGLFFDAVGAIVGHLESAGDTRAALSHARHAVAVDPLREEGQQHLIRLLAADAQPGAALRQYREYERLLEEEIGGEPSAALRALFRQVKKASGLLAPAAVPAVIPRKHAPRTPPAGSATVTFLMTDIEASTRLFHQSPEAYPAARERHHALLRREFSRRGGQEVQDSGDGFVVAFPTAVSALACAVAAQQALAGEAWPEGGEPLKVRMALHTGDVRHSGDDGQYSGIVLHHASRMLTAAHGGQILVSDATASLVAGGSEAGVRLVDLGVYRLRDVPEPKRLFQAEYLHMAQSDFGPLAAEAGHRANVPPRFTRFFGRKAEISRLQEMLRSPDVRLVTVTGLGGNGKTRLSLEVAERLVETFAGAVYFVALQDLTDPGLIPGAILDSLSAGRVPQKEPLEQAVEALSQQPALLVLDNFEHLVEGGAGVVQTLLTRAPSLKLLTTSRQLLGLSAERELVVSPLPVPGTEESPEQLSLYDSVRLFIDRAQQVMPHFQVNNANAPAVAALVGGLEGIPLAIELAAARVQVLTPSQMLSQLSHRFDFLASRKRDVPERQRTLRGALEWSYRLLAPELQRFFARLSVFRGGWSVEAADRVCEEPLALDYLEQLTECSLVLPGDTGSRAPRFRMLETLREYAQEQVAGSKEFDGLRERHLSHFLTLAEEAQPHLTGAQQGHWLSRLEEEHDNLRSAFDWSIGAGVMEPGSEGALQSGTSSTPTLAARFAGTRSNTPAERGLRLAASLARFWMVRGHWKEGRERYGAVLSHPHARERTMERADALQGAGILAWRQSDYAAARLLYGESRAILEEIGDRKGLARSLHNLGILALDQGDYQVARSLFEQSLPLNRELGNRFGESATLSTLGIVASNQGDFTTARAYFQECLALNRALGDRHTLAGTLMNLGGVASDQGDQSMARSCFEEALGLQRELGDKDGLALTLNCLGILARQEGDFAAARSLLSEGLSLCRELGNRHGVAYALEAFAFLAQVEGQEERAIRHFGAADALRVSLGTPRTPKDREGVDQALADLRNVVGEDGFTREWEAGRAMDWEAAVALA